MQNKKIVIDLVAQTLTMYLNERSLSVFRCVTGDSKHPTPKGKFRIMAKELKRKSFKYNAQMNYAMQITTSGIFIHESYNYVTDPKQQNPLATFISDTTATAVSHMRGIIPEIAKIDMEVGGLNVTGSHGCIRLAHSDAVTLFNWAVLKTLVVIK